LEEDVIATYRYYCSECGGGLDDSFDECSEHPDANVLRNITSCRTAGRDEQDDEDE
jgi:hypothetical protein